MQGSLTGLRVAFAAMEGFPNLKGSGVRITQMCSALAEAGAEVHLITLRGQGQPALLSPAVQLHPVRRLEDNYLARAISFSQGVERALFALKPDVIHVRGPFEAQAALRYRRTRAARLLFEVNGLPSVELVYHYPQLMREPRFEGKLRSIEQAALRSADGLLTQSHATARFIRLRAPTAPPAWVIPNGADPERFEPAERPQQGPLDIVYAGSLAPWQGLHGVLQALRQARREQDMRLTVIGPARRAWTRQLAKQARATKTEDLLSVVDALPQAELIARLCRADIALAPLQSDRRNRVQGCSPIKIFEYMAAGTAVLATDLPCLRELIDDGEDGRLARCQNPHRTRDAILELGADPAARQALGRAARRRVQTQATWAHRRASLVEAYRAILGRPDAPPAEASAPPPRATP